MAESAKQRICFAVRFIFVGFLLLSGPTLRLAAQTVQPFRIQWQKSFGGTSNEGPWRIAVARDGGYMVTASSTSGIGGNKETPNFGNGDAWLLRLDAILEAILKPRSKARRAALAGTLYRGSV